MLLTASRLATYQRCPREHELYYLKGYRPVAPVATMRLGTLVHSGLEQWWQGQPVSLPVDADPWDLARARPMLAGYTARWERSEYVTLAVEVEFEAPLKGRDWSLGGRIDAIVRDGQGRDWVVEHKTAGVDISRGSTYWQRLSLDSQVGIYMLGAARLGFNPCGVIYDVLGKPQLRPYEVNSRRVEAETPAQFETRVAAAIAADPDRYYQRGELVRTSEEMAEVMSDLLGVVNLMGVDEYAVRNPGACERYGRICGFFPVCSRQASLLDERLFRHSNVVNPELSGIQTKEVSE